MKIGSGRERATARACCQGQVWKAGWSISARRGAAIISTLLVLTVLTIMVVAFLQSMRIDRLTARAYLNKARAEMAARAGAEEAQDILRRLMEDNPDAVTAWVPVNNTYATVLYYRQEHAPRQIPRDYEAHVWARPLLSGAESVASENLSDSFDDLDASNSPNFNTSRWTGQPWLGQFPGQSPVEIRAPWVEVKDENGDLVARYAWWVEDESFRFPVNQAGSALRGTDSPGADPLEIPLQALLEILRTSLPDYAGLDPNTAADQIRDYRASLPVYQSFFDLRLLNRALPGSTKLYDDLAWLITGDSASLNLSRAGTRRLNLNHVVTDTFDPGEIRLQLDRIIRAIEVHLPGFGQRFYRNGNVTPPDLNTEQVGTAPAAGYGLSHEQIYLEKLAANIRDAIDSDHQPTVVKNDSGRSIRIGTAPTHAVGFAVGGNSKGVNDVIAMGKEPVPYLQEYALRARTLAMTPPRRSAGVPTFAAYRIAMDHYFEFWNPTNRDILLEDLGPNPFIKIYSQPAYDTGGGTPIPEGRDFQIPLADFVDGKENPLVFRANQATVLTTDADPASSLCPDRDAVFRPKNPNSYKDVLGQSTRIFEGQTARVNTSGWFRVNLSPRATSQSDYHTEMLIGNDRGIIESFCALPIPQNLSINADNSAIINHAQYFFRGGSLRGNSSNRNQVGDPLTNNEQLFIQRYRSAGDQDQTRYYNSGLNNAAVPSNSNFGNARNTFTDTKLWPDRIERFDTTAAGAPYVIPNRPFQSIGELGHVFDPARDLGPGGIDFSRGGGRTLKIGQPERRDDTANPTGLWDGNFTSASRERVSWRLCDIFSVRSEFELPGRINPNGILRDNGFALRALIRGFKYHNHPDSSPDFAGKEIAEEKVVNAIRERLFPDGPNTPPKPKNLFWERGELSELAIFNSGDSLVSGQNTAEQLDRGREELARRIIELIEPRGSVFSVYVVAQSVQETASGKLRVLAAMPLKVTFRLRPVFGTPADDNFDPGNPSEVAARFAQPARYEIEIIR